MDNAKEPARIEAQTTFYVYCPWCSERDADISHYLARNESPPRFRPYSCHACGRHYHVEIAGERAYTEKVEGPAEFDKLVLLRIPPQQEPIYLVLSAREYSPETGCGGGDRYFYDEHTCPTNWTDQIALIFIGDDMDPHGLAEWMSSIPESALDNVEGNDFHTKMNSLSADAIFDLFWVDDDR